MLSIRNIKILWPLLIIQPIYTKRNCAALEKQNLMKTDKNVFEFTIDNLQENIILN